jgi:hypothetical protein
MWFAGLGEVCWVGVLTYLANCSVLYFWSRMDSFMRYTVTTVYLVDEVVGFSSSRVFYY